MDVVAHLLDDLLGDGGTANYLHLLAVQVVQPITKVVGLLQVGSLLLSRVETDQRLEYLVTVEIGLLLVDLLLHEVDVLLNSSVVFLHGLVEADDGLGDLLLEVGEEALDDSHHLEFGLLDPLLEIVLLADLLLLVVLHVEGVVAEFLDYLLEEGVEVADYLVHAEWRQGYF